MAVASPALSVHELCVRIGSQQLVHGLSFEVMPGERVCLLGASGSGKSVTASAVLGLLSAPMVVHGSIRIMGEEVAHLPMALRPPGARAAMVFQDSQSALNPLVSIGTQLQETLRRRQGLKRDAPKQAAIKLLEAMRLPKPEDTLRRCSAEISGGQRQRVCIALALACNTALLVADEPTTALDVVSQAQVLRVLKASTTGPTAPALLLITHDLGAAAQICDRAVIIQNGALVEAGPMNTIISAPRHPFTRTLIAAARAGSLDQGPPGQAAA